MHDLENPRSMSWRRSQFKVTMWVKHPIDPHLFPIPDIQHFQNLTLKIKGQVHRSRSQSRYNTPSTHIAFVPCLSALPILGYSYFNIRRWKFKVKVMGEIKVESHSMGPTFSQLASLSLSVNQASHSWVTPFAKIELDIQRVTVKWTLWLFPRT